MNMALMKTEPITVFCPVARRQWIASGIADGTKWCRVHGLEVLRVEKSLRTPPRIFIRAVPLCDQIEGAVSGYERGRGGEIRYRFTFRFGCEIRWDETGNHARRVTSLERAYKKYQSVFYRIWGWMKGVH